MFAFYVIISDSNFWKKSYVCLTKKFQFETFPQLHLFILPLKVWKRFKLLKVIKTSELKENGASYEEDLLISSDKDQCRKQNRKIKQNWIKPENINTYFWVSFWSLLPRTDFWRGDCTFLTFFFHFLKSLDPKSKVVW